MTDHSDALSRDETLIASDLVEGTAVYSSNHERLGRIDNIMINKRSGQAEFAVMSFGGFLGLGEHQYPLPWSKLNYDKDAGGYVVDITPEELKAAPHFSRDERPPFDPAYNAQLGSYYGM